MYHPATLEEAVNSIQIITPGVGIESITIGGLTGNNSFERLRQGQYAIVWQSGEEDEPGWGYKVYESVIYKPYKNLAAAKRALNKLNMEEEVSRISELVKSRAILREGVCPTCGAKLKRNLSMTGWWQCSQLGAEDFRADKNKPSCNFQMFTR